MYTTASKTTVWKRIVPASLVIAAAGGLLLTVNPVDAAAGRLRDRAGAKCVQTVMSGDRLGDKLDDLVADGTLTADQRDAVTTALTGDRTDRSCAGIRVLREHAVGNAVRDLLGMDRGEIRFAWQDGQSLAEMAEARGIDRATLVSTIVDAIDGQLDKLVANERITADRKAEIMDEITPRIETGIDLHKGDLRDAGSGESTPESSSIESIAI